MAADVNIQSLFARLRMEHLLVYLTSKGWNSAHEVRPDRVRFELEDGENPFVLILPKSNQSMHAHSLLQKAVFSLSGIEDRQPADIMRDILSASPGDGPSGKLRQRIRLRVCNNDLEDPLTLRIASRATENVLMPGEEIEIVVDQPDETSLQIGFSKTNIRINDRKTRGNGGPSRPFFSDS